MRGMLPSGEPADMTDLVHWGLGEGRRVRSYPLREFWLDVGRPVDYERANREAPTLGFESLGAHAVGAGQEVLQ
jgi:NDP-sugar pyrophosphorylase family protein